MANAAEYPARAQTDRRETLQHLRRPMPRTHLPEVRLSPTMPDSLKLPDDFHGRVRLFPLPNVVLFPHVIQPLHIFEPRYCHMLRDSLADDKLIAMATLAPAGLPSSLGEPPLAPYVCLGRIVSHTPTEDGRHHILLLGLRRGRLIQELLPQQQTYRLGQMEILEDSQTPAADHQLPAMRHQLLSLFRQALPAAMVGPEGIDQLLDKQLPMGMLTDLIAASLNFPSSVKLELLGETMVEARALMLIRTLRKRLGLSSDWSADEPAGGPSTPFPPRFSVN
jgi:Lon protease-like protein